MSILAALLIGLFVGFLVGGSLIFDDHKGKTKIGQVPYIDESGRMSWKVADANKSTYANPQPGQHLYSRYDPLAESVLFIGPVRKQRHHSSSNIGRNKRKIGRIR